MHAVAVNTCFKCGAPNRFRDQRSGDLVDRSEEAVRDLTAKAKDLHRQGITHVEAVAGRVNARIMETARRVADETDEEQNPPQANAHWPEYMCRDCDPDGQGSLTRKVGPARLVLPRKKFEMLKESLARSETERHDERPRS